MSRSTTLLVAALLLTAPLAAGCDRPGKSGAAKVEFRGKAASAELAKIFADSDETGLRMSPLSALARGDQRYAEQYGDYITDEYIAAQKAAAETDLRRLEKVDRASLSPEEQVAYDVFAYQTRQGLKGFSPELLAATVTRPIDHLNGAQIQFPGFSSGASYAPFKTVKDYDNGLKRLDGYVVYLDRAIGRMREGMKSGAVQPKMTVRNMIGQMDEAIAQGVDKSPFYQPVANMPKSLSTADRQRLQAAYRAELNDKVLPTYRRLRSFLKDEYLPASRDSVGISSMTGGATLYDYLAEQQTTTRMKPDEIHQLGLSEVARIRGEMEKIKAEVGFQGDLQAFFAHLRVMPSLKPKSAEDLRQSYASIEQRVMAAIPSQFSVVPKSKLEVRKVPAFLEKSQAGGYYDPGSIDGTRPGVFYFNTYDLPSRSILTNETLFLHEGAPGHHFQISLAQENTRLPKFLRYGYVNAFTEGWALYAESLGPQLGMFKDPYQRFGHLSDEMLRAMRLVVDTGLHTKGWSREKAIDYMLDNSPMGRTEATSEVERYIADPGQALGYKIGALTIRRLRTKAETALGPKFDPRAFHAQVLDTGALPLEVLEAKIDRWIAATKKA